MAYNGTKLGQDSRFQNPDTKILSSMKTPKIFSTTVSKKNIIILPIIKIWLNQKIIEFLEFEDETLVNLIINLINSSNEKIDPKNMQYQLSGFLGDKTYSFMKKFWKLLINVQECYLKDKKIPDELIKLKEEDDKNKSLNKKYERNKEYEDDYNENDKNDNKYDNRYEYEDKTKIELMKVIDSYKKDEKYKIRNKSRSRSRSRNKSYEKIKYKSRSKEKESRKEKEEYKYKSRSKKRRHKRKRSESSSRSKSNYKDRKYRREKEGYNYDYKKNKSKHRKYSKDYSDTSSSISDDYDYYSKSHKNKKDYDNYKQRRDRSISSSDSSSETYKI